MNSQTKIVFLLILSISMEMTLIKADFLVDRSFLGACFKTLLGDVQSWYRYRTKIDACETYQTLLEGSLITGPKSFAKQTKAAFETLISTDYFEGDSINWNNEPETKAAAIVQVCKDIENTECLKEYYAPNIPLVDYLEEIYNKTGVDKAEFNKYCKTKAANR